MPDARTWLSDRSRVVILVATAVAILAVVNTQIMGKQRIVDSGDTVLLRLAPIDPRSLLQGDYMALRYAMANDVARAAQSAQVSDGRIVIELAQNGEASFVDLYQGQPLSGTERLLKFRKRGESVRLASDAFFFEEGEWDTYSSARFGELRVSEEGDAVLVALRDAAANRLGPSLH